MHKRTIMFGILGIFICVQVLGLYTASQLVGFLEENPDLEMFEDPGNVMNSFQIFGYIMVGTIILILIIKYVKHALQYLELAIVFLASEVTFEALIPYSFSGIPIAVFFALALAIWKFRWPSVMNQNIALIFSLSGAGALIGTSLYVLPIMIFAAILSLYDIIAVFFTKHMVFMAKALTEKPLAFVAAIPVKFKEARKVMSMHTGKEIMQKKHVFLLGGGDLALPLILAASIYRYFSLGHAIFSLIGALLATFYIFWVVLQKPGKPLPALPPIVAGAFLGFAVAVFTL